MQANTTEAHGVAVDLSIFASAPAFPSNPYPPKPTVDLQLAAGSAAIDKGVVLAAVNDNFTGVAPDLGAYELGVAPPTYGPRQSGTGGAVGTGGTMGIDGGPAGTGGTLARDGGATATGGATASGGATAIDASLGTGGVVTASGGVVGSGGTPGSGGRIGTGGLTGSGGKVGSGGSVGAGGAVGSGGVASTGLAGKSSAVTAARTWANPTGAVVRPAARRTATSWPCLRCSCSASAGAAAATPPKPGR